PWAALYASAEREALRADGGRHRPPARVRTAGRHSYDTLTPATYIPVQARPSGYAATQAACGARQAEATALQTTYADVEADFEAWQAQCASARPGPGSWWPDGRSGPAE
ncbi:MAG: hypothetical protein HKP61_09595, partial [Dactylosporangium sp.]|nr:hypothetical protein [Dactylosporangium sp.]NNJ61186.1 hypothetical protein [Dactylosporangium sp.]